MHEALTCGDSRSTLSNCGYLADQFRQTRAAFALHLSSAWGLRTNEAQVREVQIQAEELQLKLESELLLAGLVREDGTRDTKAAARRMLEVCRANGFKVRRTASHTRDECTDESDCHVCLDKDACDSVAEFDEILPMYAELSTTKKVLSNDVEMLLTGIYGPIHPRYDIAETGRTTCSKPNIQNLRRLPGIREAFIPRPGYVFAQADYPQLELFTLAQCCKSWVGFSKLGEALNAGLDPHLAVAAQILRLSYEVAESRYEQEDPDVVAMRQLAKVLNFGFPGGLGIDKFILFAKKSLKPSEFLAANLTRERVLELKARWFEAWPEMPRYFSRINALTDEITKRANVESLFTERFRGDATYCAACNSGFQGLGSDCAKNAAWLLTKAMYVDQESPLYNARMIAFVHDEFILEVKDDEHASDAAFELARLMVDGANKYLPDVPIPLAKVKPLLMRRWSKKAKQIKDERGRLIPWS